MKYKIAIDKTKDTHFIIINPAVLGIAYNGDELKEQVAKVYIEAVRADVGLTFCGDSLDYVKEIFECDVEYLENIILLYGFPDNGNNEKVRKTLERIILDEKFHLKDILFANPEILDIKDCDINWYNNEDVLNFANILNGAAIIRRERNVSMKSTIKPWKKL